MTEPCRRFTLLDAMILVAAVAAGFALLRPLSPGVFQGFGAPDYLRGAAMTLYGMAQAAACLLSPMSVALLILRLRATRPAWRSLRRQPGLLSSVAVMLAWTIFGLLVAWDRLRRSTAWDDFNRDPKSMPMELIAGVDGVAIFAGWIVAVAWFVQYLAGGCRPEPNWIERAGRILGACWIGLAALMAILLV